MVLWVWQIQRGGTGVLYDRDDTFVVAAVFGKPLLQDDGHHRLHQR